MYYIQETDRPNLIFELFNIITLKGDKIILPITANSKLSDKKMQKLAEKTKKILDKTMCKKIVVSKELEMQETYINLLYSYSLDISDGKWLFEVLCDKILDYAMQYKKIKKEETAISILVNDLSENIIGNLRKIVKQYKSVNIVTNHIEKFKILEEQILDEDGIMITVGNNKRKGISKSKVILNVDFPTELINLYCIDENAIIINLRGNVKITKKRFNGICINDYEITYDWFDELDFDKRTKYKACKIYEAEMNKRQPFQEIMKNIQRDRVKITKLIGSNNEFLFS